LRKFAMILLSLCGSGIAALQEIPPPSTALRYLGRTLKTDSTAYRWDWSGSGVAMSFQGTACWVHLFSPGAVYRVVVDGVDRGPLDLRSGVDTLHAVATGLAQGPHEVVLSSRTEPLVSSATFFGFRIDGTPLAAGSGRTRKLEFYGNSITCGYGILDSIASNPFAAITEDEGKTFAAQAADSLAADRHTVCWSGKGVILNNGKDTLTPTLPKLHDRVLGTDSLHKWNFSSWTPDAVVIDLGTNDYSAVAPDSAWFEAVYAALVDSLHHRYPAARFVLVDGPMLSDGWPTGIKTLTQVRRHLDNIVARVALAGANATHLSLTPSNPSRGYGADTHPNLAQATLNGQELAAHLRKVLGWTTTSLLSRTPTAPRRGALVSGESGWDVRIPLGASGRSVDPAGRELQP